MVMEDIKKIQSGDKDLRSFSRVVGGVFCALGAFFWWKGHTIGPIFVGIGIPILVLGVIWLRSLKPVHKFWMTLAILMGFVVSRIILTVVFFLVITPIGLIMRLFGKRFIENRFRTEEASYWTVRDYPHTDPKRFENQF